jgi:hypothetical protein
MTTQPTTPLLNQAALTLLSLATLLFFGWQLSKTRELKSQLETANEQRAVLIEQATSAQLTTSQQLEAFLSDLLVLAETDPQAAALAERYQIRRNQSTEAAQPAE